MKTPIKMYLEMKDDIKALTTTMFGIEDGIEITIEELNSKILPAIKSQINTPRAAIYKVQQKPGRNYLTICEGDIHWVDFGKLLDPSVDEDKLRKHIQYKARKSKEDSIHPNIIYCWVEEFIEEGKNVKPN